MQFRTNTSSPITPAIDFGPLTEAILALKQICPPGPEGGATVTVVDYQHTGASADPTPSHIFMWNWNLLNVKPPISRGSAFNAAWDVVVEEAASLDENVNAMHNSFPTGYVDGEGTFQEWPNTGQRAGLVRIKSGIQEEEVEPFRKVTIGEDDSDTNSYKTVFWRQWWRGGNDQSIGDGMVGPYSDGQGGEYYSSTYSIQIEFFLPIIPDGSAYTYPHGTTSGANWLTRFTDGTLVEPGDINGMRSFYGFAFGEHDDGYFAPSFSGIPELIGSNSIRMEVDPAWVAPVVAGVRQIRFEDNNAIQYLFDNGGKPIEGSMGDGIGSIIEINHTVPDGVTHDNRGVYTWKNYIVDHENENYVIEVVEPITHQGWIDFNDGYTGSNEDGNNPQGLIPITLLDRRPHLKVTYSEQEDAGV